MLTQAALFAFIATSPLQTPDSLDLALRVEPGKSFVMKSVTVMAQTTTGALEDEGTTTTTLEQKLSFGAKNAEGQALSVTTDTVKLTAEGSAAVDTTETEQILRGMNLSFLVGPRAQSVKLEITSSNQPSANQKAIFASQTEMMRQTGPLGIIYPAEAIKVGTAWSTDIDLGEPLKIVGQGSLNPKGNTKVKNNYKILSLETLNGRSIVKIESKINGKVDFDMSVAGVPFGGSSSIQSTTIYIVDALSGMLISSESTGVSQSDMGVVNLKQETKTSVTVTPIP